MRQRSRRVSHRTTTSICELICYVDERAFPIRAGRGRTQRQPANHSLPPYLGFFTGKRFVPIVTAFAAIGLGLALSLVWPPIGAGIKSFSHWAAESNLALAFSIYGLIERLLIPFGLHHIWNAPFFFEVGSYADPTTGNIITDEIQRYIAGDPTASNMAVGYL